MFNPLYPFTAAMLNETVKRGCVFFVRNALYPPSKELSLYKDHFIFCHYDDHAKAEAHYNSIGNDPKRFLYDWRKAEHKERLQTAAGGSHGYKLYSAYFMPDYKSRITREVKEKINRYIYRHTAWKPAGGDKIGIDLFLQFGILYLTMKYEEHELSCKFADIESQ